MLDLLLGKNIKRYFEAGHEIVACGEVATKEAFEAMLELEAFGGAFGVRRLGSRRLGQRRLGSGLDN